MKNQPLTRRLGFALAGLRSTLRSENSFKTHIAAAGLVLAALVWRRPAPVWWAIVVLTIVLVLVAELINTALEQLADHLHPEEHPRIRVVKDCAAAAVLIATLGALAVAVSLLYAMTE